MTSTIKFMEDKDFYNGPGEMLVCSLPKYALVMFYSTQCAHCAEMKNVFMDLNQKIEGCNFGMINVDDNKGVIDKCNKGGVELTYVPFVVFFANKKPYMVYTGPCVSSDLERFIVDVSNDYRSKNMNNKITQPENNSYSDRFTQHQESNDDTYAPSKDACAIGDEECISHKSNESKRKMCYLSIDEAYSS